MKDWIKKIIKEVVVDIPYKTNREVIDSMFSYIGVERLKEVIKELEENKIEYANFAEIYSRILRNNLSKENSERMHAYYELLPKLDEYSKALKIKKN